MTVSAPEQHRELFSVTAGAEKHRSHLKCDMGDSESNWEPLYPMIWIFSNEQRVSSAARVVGVAVFEECGDALLVVVTGEQGAEGAPEVGAQLVALTVS